MAKSKKNYCDSKELERVWFEWLSATDSTRREELWQSLTLSIYKICEGVAVHFKPRSVEEHIELTHETFTTTLVKIKAGKIKPIAGKAPVFNLLTTAIIRQLYSLMNRNSRQKRLYDKYRLKYLEEKFPESRVWLQT